MSVVSVITLPKKVPQVQWDETINSLLTLRTEEVHPVYLRNPRSSYGLEEN